MKKTLTLLLTFLSSFLILVTIEYVLTNIIKDQSILNDLNKVSSTMEDILMDTLEELNYYKALDKLFGKEN